MHTQTAIYNVFIVFRHELRAYFSSPIGYIAIGLYLLAVWLFLWVIPGSYNVFDNGYAQLDGLFALSPWLFMLLCPALTMRLIAEEKLSGTWDIILTRPVEPWQIVSGKLLAAWTVCLIALLPNVLSYAAVSYLAQPAGNVDGGAFIGGMTGLVALVAVNSAVGLFASALTRSQIVAFIIAAALCFTLFYGFDLLCSFIGTGSILDTLTKFGFHEHYKSVSRGVLVGADIVYFLAVTLLFGWLTTLIAKRRP